MNSEEITIPGEPFISTGKKGINSFEKQYIRLRNKEQRIVTDEDLLKLPDVIQNHPYFNEWKIRKKSAIALIRYLSKKKQSLKILEIGCGNGWLSKMLASISDSDVTGTDINSTELEQATRTFVTIPNLTFIASDIQSSYWDSKKFDCILFAASIQYFSSCPAIISRSLELLNENGEMHIIDSPFYQEAELPAAKERSVAHFIQTGFLEMASYYFHHSWNDITTFNHKILYKPSPFQKYILQNKNPFPWICVKKL